VKEIKQSSRLGEQYTVIKHSSGLTLKLCPMEGYSSAYALFATNYGSVDNCFKTGEDPDFLRVPEGIAHFLEHKLFESEEGDAFTRYAETGATANAYTTFDRTAYLFSCSENFAQSIDILLDFVTKPYFTPATVEKEQGIIGQEIKMYEDNPDARVFFNLLVAMYHKNPVRIDIVGTVDSIAQIDADILYRCYRTFYNLNNMVLAIAGSFEVDTVLEACDRILKPAAPIEILREQVEEPKEVREKRVEQHLPVAVPLFQIGFKGDAAPSPEENMLGQVEDEILMDIIAGESTTLYRQLYDEGLINATFVGDAMASRDYTLTVYGGESRDPDEVCRRIVAEIQRLGSQGIDPDVFQRTKKAAYGRYVGMFGRVESVAGLMVVTHFSGVEMYSLLDKVASVTLEEMERRLKGSFDTTRCALSVVCGG